MSDDASAGMLALRAFVWPDLSQWYGLPPCTLADIAQVFHVESDGQRGSGTLGEAHCPRSWLTVAGKGFPEGVRVWLDGDQVVGMDTALRCATSDFDALIGQLGPSENMLDFHFSNALIPGGEWVYPHRGLTLFVEPELHCLLRIAAYPSTNLPRYRAIHRLLAGRWVKHPVSIIQASFQEGTCR